MSRDTKKIRENILRASRESGHGHIPTSFSVVEMITAVYDKMRHNPKDPKWEDRDLFVLSKGHAALGFYAVLSEFGYIPSEELKTFGANGSRLGCHPDRFKAPGAEVSCGSLGHGIGVAVGMALAFKIKKSPRNVYVLIGDGESNEGSVWESIMIAADQKLPQLTILYDDNHSQIRCLQIKNPAEKLRAFGCEVHEVNGHDLGEIRKALDAPQETIKAIVCHTVKGYGCKTLEDNIFEWHRKSPNDEQLTQLLRELHA
jgi:transketolase